MNLSLPAPSAPPTFVSVSSVTSSSITVQWRAVDCIHRNGDITGHIVQYGIQGSGSTVRKNVPGGAATEATLTGLTSATAYYVEVAAVNSVGIEVYSESSGKYSRSDRLYTLNCACWHPESKTIKHLSNHLVILEYTFLSI